MAETIRIVPPAPEHRGAWEALYAGYAVYYRVEQTAEMRARVWSWLRDPAHESEGLLALNDAGTPVGLAHFRPFARPLSASTGGFLDDLFVDPAARGSGAVQALMAELRAIARQRGWSVIRWITREDNYRARAAYDRLAARTDWVTYDMAPR